MTLNEYSSFMNDKLHLFEKNEERNRKVISFIFKDKAKAAWKEFSKKYSNTSSNENMDKFLKAKFPKKQPAEINALIQEALKPNTGSGNKEDEAKQLKANYDAAKKAYSDKIDAIKKGIDLKSMSLDDMNAIWNEAKQLEKEGKLK